MKKVASLVLLVLLACLTTYGQDSTARWFVLKTDPFWLLHRQQRIFSLMGEVRVAPRLSLQQEVGYLYDQYLDAGRGSPVRGAFNYTFRTELRKYWRRSSLSGLYGGVQLVYRQHNYQTYTNYCPDADCAVQQRDDYRIRRTSQGAYLKGGYQLFLRRRISLDLNVGIGAIRTHNRLLGSKGKEPQWQWGDDTLDSRCNEWLEDLYVDYTENKTRTAPNATLYFTVGYELK